MSCSGMSVVCGPCQLPSKMKIVMLILGQATQSMVQRFDTHTLKLLEFVERMLRVEQVPIARVEFGIVDLQHILAS